MPPQDTTSEVFTYKLNIQDSIGKSVTFRLELCFVVCCRQLLMPVIDWLIK